jgi:hypothetical protein
MIITKQIPDHTISPDRFQSYWGDMTAYSQQEITTTLTEAQSVKAEHDAVIDEVGRITDFDPIWHPLADHLRPLHDLYLACLDDEPCITSRTRSTAHEPFPVKEWQRQIAKARRQIRQLRNGITTVS